jgi:hypothetical protein
MHKRFAAEQLDMLACANDNQYVCGSQLFPAGHKLYEAVGGNHSLTWSSPVRSSLYKANSATLNKIADSLAVSLCSSCGIEHLPPERSEQLGCNQTVQASAWQCWPLCSMCSDEGLVPPQKKCKGIPAAVKREVVGVKRKRMAGIGWGGARGRGAGRGGRGKGLGILVCLSSEEEADIIALDVQKHADAGANTTQEQQQAGLLDEDGDSCDGEGQQFADSEDDLILSVGHNRREQQRMI